VVVDVRVHPEQPSQRISNLGQARRYTQALYLMRSCVRCVPCAVCAVTYCV
jgi:hypothetical protein